MTQNNHAHRRKYNSVVYASKLEAEFAEALDYLQGADNHSGVQVVWVAWQVPFCLPWGARYTLDFIVGKADGSWCCVEVKGIDTREAKERRKALEWFLGFKVNVWTKGGWKQGEGRQPQPDGRTWEETP